MKEDKYNNQGEKAKLVYEKIIECSGSWLMIT